VDPLDVITGLIEWWHAVKTPDVSLARVVGRDHLVLIPAEAVAEIPQIFGARDDVL
jgi:hypothetical protein